MPRLQPQALHGSSTAAANHQTLASGSQGQDTSCAGGRGGGETDREGGAAEVPPPLDLGGATVRVHRLSESCHDDSAPSSVVVNGVTSRHHPEGEAVLPPASGSSGGRAGLAAAILQPATLEERANALQLELRVEGGEQQEKEEEEEEGDKEEGGSDSEEEDLYEDDDSTPPLAVVDCSATFGCMELETLCLDNVNLTDQVLAVLMQSLPHLRFLNVSDTDICNPWRLLDMGRASHLKYLCHLDVRSTALSRTALQLVPQFHPDLQKLSISSTMLPPCTYASIGRLTGVADLELIGGQFYPVAPEEIFENGIAPAIKSIGKHLRVLNLTYFAHIVFEAVILNCPIIETLDLSYTKILLSCPCPSLGDCCPNLTTLNLAYSHISATKKKREGGNSDDTEPVADVIALQEMVGSPPNLEELFLGGLSVQDDTLFGLFPGIRHPLRVLDVSRCNMVSIAGVEYVWRHCPLLRSLDLRHCRAITQADYQRFEKMCCEERPRFKVEGKINWI